MLTKLGLKNTMKGSLATGIEIILLPTGGYSINVVVLRKKKSILITEKQLEGIKSIEELATVIDKKQPLVIIINGKGVLHRKVSFYETDAAITLLNKVLPNANSTEFSLQQTPINENQVIVSIIRSNLLNEITNELQKNNLTTISGYLLGPFVINTLLPSIKSVTPNSTEFAFGKYSIHLQEQQIIDVSTTSETITEQIEVGNDNINSNLLVAFAAALSYFTSSDRGIINSELINNLKEEYEQKQKFDTRGAAVLIVSFSILLINYVVFNHFWNKNKEQDAILTFNQSALNRYDTLKLQFAQKKGFLEQNGLLEHSKTSYFADQLAQLLPSTIQWTDVNIHPKKKIKTETDEDTFFFESKQIAVSGNCQLNTDLNEWMKKIKKKTWIKNVTLLNFTQHNEATDGQFVLEIKLNN